MARHVCGTCRFFRANEPSAKSGWCGHPQKQTTTDVRILVRAGELNCRNDWDHDLWQLREDGDRVLDVTMRKSVGSGGPSERATPPEGPRALGHDDAGPRLDAPTAADRVVHDEAAAPRLVSENLDRELLRRAREQFRERRQASRPDGPPPRPGDDPAPTLHRPDAIVISNEVQPLPIGQPPPPDLTRLSSRERAAVGEPVEPVDTGSAFSSIPALEPNVELPRPASDRTDVIPTVDDFEVETFRHYEEAIESRRSTWQAPSPPERSEPQPEPVARERGERRDGPVGAPPAESVERPERRERPSTVTRQHERDGDQLVGHSAAYEPERQTDAEEIRPWDYVEPRRPRAGDVDPRELGRISTPSSSRLWDDIPRSCRTCRDFRAAETGGRGWCTNRWAFRHRRMVDIDELPCETTIGAWWLPTDDAWQDDQDIGRHAQATPLMDRWVGRLEPAEDAPYLDVATRTRRRR